MTVTKNIIITCEHGGNQIPIRYRSLFDENALQQTTAWDEGALDLALSLAEELDVPCFAHQTSRLLVDVNLSLGNKGLFILNSTLLGDADRQNILERYYFPYRLRLENTIAMSDKALVHVSLHTTPEQQTDITLIFNSKRTLENECALILIDALNNSSNSFRVSTQDVANTLEDSFVQYLRTRFDDEAYAGLTLIVHPRLTSDENIIVLVEKLSKALSLLRS
ncbi:N-formylglutamate amidohydrolase [Chryseotalea sanaruensis]|uniref:N-formylglutamate amidohydrolase n=1 Tax=Chryseotalea sanaruensis TaxID=2482724 RepID=A0A401UCD8_9BACT|nr:N-formylglutamate amidohydrolase [Chryseotalea sanaruensis]GCC52581.1 N-formylglutamate amidohydrolase [Chryseotalea sanaruensis]